MLLISYPHQKKNILHFIHDIKTTLNDLASTLIARKGM